MVKKIRHIVILESDFIRFNKEVKERFMKAYPFMEGKNVTQSQLFNDMVNFYLGAL